MSFPTFRCSICSDTFDGVERLGSAPCGHVYHSKCLHQWIEVKENCPECRKTVAKNSVTELYFNVRSEDENNTLKNEITTLKSLLQEKTDEAKTLADKNKDMLNIMKVDGQEIEVLVFMFTEFADLCKTAEKDKKAIQTLDEANIVLQQKLKSSILETSALKKRLAEIEAQKETLKRELDLFEDVKRIVMGVQGDAEELLNKTANGATNTKDLAVARRLAHCCCLTKRELKKAVDENNKLNKCLEFTKTKVKIANEELKKIEETGGQLNDAEFDGMNAGPSTSTDFPTAKRKKYDN